MKIIIITGFGLLFLMNNSTCMMREEKAGRFIEVLDGDLVSALYMTRHFSPFYSLIDEMFSDEDIFYLEKNKMQHVQMATILAWIVQQDTMIEGDGHVSLPNLGRIVMQVVKQDFNKKREEQPFLKLPALPVTCDHGPAEIIVSARSAQVPQKDRLMLLRRKIRKEGHLPPLVPKQQAR